MKLIFLAFLSLSVLVFSDTYVLEKRALNYAQAKANCKTTFGGELAIIKDAATNAKIQALLRALGSSSAFIGLEVSTKWSWHDGSAATYFNWNAGEPNGLRENVGEIYSSTGKWNDISAAAARHSVCFVKGVTMHVESGGKTWDQAEAICETRYKGWLAKIPDRTTSNHMANMAATWGRGIPWFGGRQYGKFEKDAKTGWLYMDGTALATNLWGPGEPNQAGEEDCTNIRPDGLWNDLRCSAGLRVFFCDAGTISVAQDVKDFEFLALDTPLNQTMWYNSPMFYMVLALFVFGSFMLYHNSKSKKQDPLLATPSTYSSI